MVDTPFCNVTVATPPGDPHSAVGFRSIPPNSTLAQAIQIINNNFYNLKPQPSGNWIEQSRVVTRVRVPVTGLAGAIVGFADVDQVSRLVMQDPITGASWVWNRTGNAGP